MSFFYLTISKQTFQCFHSLRFEKVVEEDKKINLCVSFSCIVNVRQFHMHYIKETAISILMYRFLQILPYVCKT